MKCIIFIRKAKLIQFMENLIEKDDMKAVIDYLWADGNVSMIGLWGRSIGAVTSLHGQNIAMIVTDVLFSLIIIMFGWEHVLAWVIIVDFDYL